MKEQERVLIGQRELKRWHLMEMVEVGKFTLREAGERIDVSTVRRSGLGEQSGGVSICHIPSVF